LTPFQLSKRKSLEFAEFSLHDDRMTIQSLWTGVSDIEDMEDQIRKEFEAIVIKKKGQKPQKGKAVKRIRLRTLPDMPRVIHNNDDLDKALHSIEKAVKDALKANNEVELD